MSLLVVSTRPFQTIDFLPFGHDGVVDKTAVDNFEYA
jgi:hypothetical protein